MNGLRPVVIHFARRLCFLSAYSSWSDRNQWQGFFVLVLTMQTMSYASPTFTEPRIAKASSYIRTKWPMSEHCLLQFPSKSSSRIQSTNTFLLMKLKVQSRPLNPSVGQQWIVFSLLIRTHVILSMSESIVLKFNYSDSFLLTSTALIYKYSLKRVSVQHWHQTHNIRNMFDSHAY